MPFLYVLPKQGDVAPNTARLAELLCPYRGAIERHSLSTGQLYLSAIAEATPTGAAIPRGTRKNPQTAWLAIHADADGVRFETDPLGTFPLWWIETDGFVAVTGEVKALRALGVAIAFEPERWPSDRKRPPDYSPYANVLRVRPGATLTIHRDGRRTETGAAPLDYRPTAMLAAEAQAEALEAALRASAKDIGGDVQPWGAFLSGGIDSSTATALLHRHDPGIRTYTLGTAHGDEYADAAALATHLGTRHAQVFATTEQALAHFERAVFCNETIDGLSAETLAQLSVLAEVAARDVPRIVTGYGADLLFGSMLRHKLYMQVTGVDDLQSLIERTMWSGEFAPFYAWAHGVEIHHLFWDPRVMNTAFQIPPEDSFDGTTEKLVLRGLTVASGLMQQAHAFRKKQALTDGTQFNRVLSAALGLTDRYAYDAKSDRAVAILRDVLTA
ncbi:MAG: asparagine synthase C-terminal domain-containing protein [Deltaproteobacteria bacterium]|nr:asparagine synthase C-terminal domain-containing protein [Deltaproteobacteria bacterium]